MLEEHDHIVLTDDVAGPDLKAGRSPWPAVTRNAVTVQRRL